jgi:Na+/alanine symporter
MGCKRIYSNAGQVRDSILPRQQMFHPTKQVSQSFSVYIDTLLVCSAGFMLLITGKYNVQNPVLGADGATQFYTKEQMFLLVPDYNLQWIAFFLVLVLTFSYCIVFFIHNDVSLLLYC